ncbi:MAG: hypothetical protein M0R03_23525 [Novosphingobium sp.]|nr:hypothetical protein [Novosphingobium sp.]
MEILGSYWFTPSGGMSVIGIVKTKNEVQEIKYYIGTAVGFSKKEDEKHIAMYGSKFPIDVGNKLIP